MMKATHLFSIEWFTDTPLPLLAIAPFAFFFERKAQPKITFKIFMQIFILALLGPVIDQNFYYAGLKFTSPTFSCAMSNMLPAMTFVLAVICRMEKINMKKVRCQAKVVGTLVTVAGAMLMTLYKGPIVELMWSKHVHPHSSNVKDNPGNTDKDWFKGSIFLIIATLAWASLFVLQAKAIETYKNHQLTLTSLVCFVGTVQAIAVTFVAEHKTSVWRIGWDMNLLAAAYAGIVASRIIGSILIVIGLYSVLWGKHKERLESKEVEDIIPLAIKVAQVNGNAVSAIDAMEVNEVIKSEKADQSNNKHISSNIAISMPLSETQKTNKDEKA
ncbi:WAT1-related protein [Quillaja saponaria]|uniref:WAT1-related protein n=1 Tax=Quillaja saponaria TaxID=32244 RepID=A0AAD7QKX2_QUISA|nr:WAT1-related protein [Quillaja saponaria]